jgi:hypothetical protein
LHVSEKIIPYYQQSCSCLSWPAMYALATTLSTVETVKIESRDIHGRMRNFREENDFKQARDEGKDRRTGSMRGCVGDELSMISALIGSYW